MPLDDTGMVAAANGVRAVAVKARLHTADPGVGNSNPTTAAAVAVSWSAASGSGVFGLASQLSFSGGAAGGTVAYISLWDSGLAVRYGKYPITGDANFNSAGEYIVTALNINGSSPT